MSQSTFEIKTSKDLFLKLLREHKRIMNDLYSSDYAINFSITAHHLFKDWLKRELSPTAYKELQFQINTSLKKEAGIIRDICDGSKHFQLDRPPRIEISSTEVRPGEFSIEFSREFNIGGLFIVLQDGSKLYFDNVADGVIAFWKRYFESSYPKNTGSR